MGSECPGPFGTLQCEQCAVVVEQVQQEASGWEQIARRTGSALTALEEPLETLNDEVTLWRYYLPGSPERRAYERARLVLLDVQDALADLEVFQRSRAGGTLNA